MLMLLLSFSKMPHCCLQKLTQPHLIPYAAKGKLGEHFAASRIYFHWWQRLLDMGRRSLWIRIPTSAKSSARALGTERRESYGGNYSTVKSAQRESATLSIIRPNGRVQIINS